MECDYGCGRKARFKMTNGKNCCETFYSKCPEVRRKNSEKLKQAHKKDPKKFNKHILKGQMCGWKKGGYNNSGYKYKKSIEEVFVKGTTYPTSDIKSRLIEEKLIDYKCSKCGISEWMGNKISLDLHHKDGDRYNNEIENLHFLCPNCHSQTENFRGRNINSGKIKVSDKDLLNALLKQKNVRQALIKVGLAAKGSNYNRAKKLSTQLETVDVESVKFGETLTNNDDGDPERSLLKERVET